MADILLSLMYMISKLLKTCTPLEITLAVLFIGYVIFPVQIPHYLADVVDSSIGIVTICCTILFMFIYVNPVLGVLSIVVAYKLLKTCAKVTGKTSYIQYTQSQSKRDATLKEMNPPVAITLEEEIITAEVPIGHSSPSVYISSTYTPVADNIHDAIAV